MRRYDPSSSNSVLSVEIMPCAFSRIPLRLLLCRRAVSGRGAAVPFRALFVDRIRLFAMGETRICADSDRYAFSIPLPCYRPRKIEALRGQSMEPSARDEIKSAFHNAQGKAQEKAGQLTNGPDCLAEGQKIAAKVQSGIAKTAEMRGEFAPDLGK